MIKHFTSSAYVYNKEEKKFLFIKHKKLGKWLQPGGHIEDNERPEDCAIREVFEETGLQVELVGNRLPIETGNIRPYAAQMNRLSFDEDYENMDLVYLAVPIGKQALVQNTEETENIAWFSLEEIVQDSFDTYKEQKEWCHYFSTVMEREG